MSNLNSMIKTGSGYQDHPLELFQPFNIIIFLSFYSPIILATSITSLSFIFQNFKGFIYLGFLLAACVVRYYIYQWSGGIPLSFDKTICTAVQYSKYGNPSFSAFVFAFTIAYLFIPMFSNGGPNFWIFSCLLVYFFLDLFLKVYKKCVTSMSDLFINVLGGVVFSALIVTSMYAGGSGKYLFFNEISSDKELCYQPKKQTFKCSVYKDGTLVGNI
jgi:hypothetical protein